MESDPKAVEKVRFHAVCDERSTLESVLFLCVKQEFKSMICDMVGDLIGE